MSDSLHAKEDMFPLTKMRPLGDTPPSKGGCWYCHTAVDYPEDPLVFSAEYDSHVHRGCISRRLKQVQEMGNKDHEVEVLAAELEVEEDGHA